MLEPCCFLTFCFLKRSLNLNNEALTGKHPALPALCAETIPVPKESQPGCWRVREAMLGNTSPITRGASAPPFSHPPTPQRDPSTSYSQRPHT